MNDSKKPRIFYGYIIVLAALCISVVMWGTRHSFGVFFKPVLDEFGWTRAMTAGGFSLSWVMTGLLSIGVGRLNDRFGPRIVMTGGGLLLALGYLLMSRLSSIWQLYLFLGIISVSMTAAFVPLLSTVARWFVRTRALMTGIVLASSGIALIVILPVASRLITSYGWRTSYIIIGILALVVIIPAAQFLRRAPGHTGLLPQGFINVQDNNLKVQHGGISFKESLSTIQLWLLSGIYFCTYFLFYSISVHIIIHATGQGISMSMAVGIMAVLGGGGIAGRVIMGFIADRAGSKLAMIVSSVTMIVSLLLLLWAKDLPMLYIFGVIFGFGHGGLATMESPRVADIFGMRSHGTILGFVFFADTVGGAVGPFLAGYIFDITGSYSIDFSLCAVIGIINLVLVLLLRPIRPYPRK